VTYSIVARDRATGQLGIAAQSHAFGVGRMVHHVRPGIGAVASQAMALYAHGDRVLDALADGTPPDAALAASLASDADAEHRQVTVIAVDGATAAHTGARCLRFAGHHRGTDFVVAGNILEDAGVLDAMVTTATEAWPDPTAEHADRPSLARRLLAVLDAAERAGGDQRGRQSASMVVVAAEASGEPLLDRLVDIRVDDSPTPLAELRRLLDLAEAHEAMEAAEHALLDGEVDRAAAIYGANLLRMGDNKEFHVWAAVALAGAGHDDEAAGVIATLRDVPDRARWEELSRRLAERDLVPADTVAGWWT
jgi:uncharacterized Ntn-hydrolase superfamily protein